MKISKRLHRLIDCLKKFGIVTNSPNFGKNCCTMKCRLKEHGSLALMLAAINVTGSSTPPLNFNLQKEKDSWYLGLKSEIVILVNWWLCFVTLFV